LRAHGRSGASGIALPFCRPDARAQEKGAKSHIEDPGEVEGAVRLLPPAAPAVQAAVQAGGGRGTGSAMPARRYSCSPASSAARLVAVFLVNLDYRLPRHGRAQVAEKKKCRQV